MARRRNGKHARTGRSRPVAEIFASTLAPTRSFTGKLADFLNDFFGTIWFFNANVAVFAIWVAINVGWVPGVSAFDPFPFPLLTTLVSLEAIFLSIIVLMSQNRAAKLADLRSEVDFQVNVQAEREVTKMLQMLDEIQHKLGIDHRNDAELNQMESSLDIFAIQRRVMDHDNKKM